MVLNSDGIERGIKKHLLHMLISKITIDKTRVIDTIHLHLTRELVQFLQNADGTSLTGTLLHNKAANLIFSLYSYHLNQICHKFFIRDTILMTCYPLLIGYIQTKSFHCCFELFGPFMVTNMIQ